MISIEVISLIKINVSELLGKHKMNQKKLSELTGIRPNTISMLYHETIQRIDIDILNKLCKVFSCQVSDLLEYIPDDPQPNETEK
jgi:putative transcriptional regulator